MVVGTPTMTNSDFLAEIYGEFAQGTHGWVCTFRADPSNAPPAVWAGRLYKGTPQQAALIDRSGQDNTYFCTAVLAATEDGDIVRRKDSFVRLAVLVLDDVQLQDLQGYSYAIQTSPGKFQVGILIDLDDPDARNRQLVDLLMQALATRGFIKADRSGNNAVRYVRLPVGQNTKPRAAGEWAVQLDTWRPSVRWSLEDACHAIGIDLDNLRAASDAQTTKSASTPGQGVHAGEMIAGLTAPVGERVYHESITRLAASLVSNGMFPGAAVEFLRDLMHQVKPTGPEEEVRRWQSRYDEIERAVKSAEKFAPEERRVNISVSLGLPKREDGQEDTSALLMTLGQLQAKAGQVKWQVKHMIPDNSLGMFFGASGTYKSFVALDHGLHVAHGMQWMGKRTKQGRVVYLAAEGGAGIYRRVQAWHQHHGRPLTPDFHVCITPMVLSIDQHVDALASALEQLPTPARLVYIDTLSQTFEGDENSATDISAYLRLINAKIRARFDCTVVVIHHSGHAASERPRGSSAITANVDFLVGVYKPEGTAQMARLDVIKQKDGDRLANLTFRLNRVVLGHDEDGEELSSLVSEHHDMGAQIMANGMAKLAGHEQLVMHLLTQAGGQILDRDLRFAFYNRLGAEAVAGGKQYNQDTARKAYLRAYASLRDKGMVVINAAGTVTSAVQADTGPGHQAGHDRDMA
jgi:hypothetical protein